MDKKLFSYIKGGVRASPCEKQIFPYNYNNGKKEKKSFPLSEKRAVISFSQPQRRRGGEGIYVMAIRFSIDARTVVVQCIHTPR